MTISLHLQIHVFHISIHMPHTWHDVAVLRCAQDFIQFQSTCHIRGMTSCGISPVAACLFQSTCHIRGMTVLRGIASIHVLFQSTCHIRGMTFCARSPSCRLCISIHMPHTWHDLVLHQLQPRDPHFNPHATYVA